MSSLVGVGSATGSPGATTTALALAATWPRRALLLEADPDGGVLAVRLGITDGSGLTGVAAALRREATTGAVEDHVRWVSERLGVLLAPPGAEEAHRALADAERLAGCLAGLDDADVIVDCGRLSPRSPSLPLALAAATVVVVARPELDQIVAVSHAVAAMRRRERNVSVALVGERPYGRDEVAHALDAPLVGVLPHDPRAARRLPESLSDVSSWRGPLPTAVEALAGSLAASMTGTPKGPAEMASAVEQGG